MLFHTRSFTHRFWVRIKLKPNDVAYCCFCSKRRAKLKEIRYLLYQLLIMEALTEIKSWLAQEAPAAAAKTMHSRKKKGYTVLFTGASDNKLAMAGQLAHEAGKELYRIDLAQVLSRYIGETEKALDALFEEAEEKKYILYFDEADALFGKRTKVRDAHDRYANQEVSYVLKRLKDYPGLSIVSTSSRTNIDAAFIRRFKAIVPFGKEA